jgi:hypothetical protein
MVPARIAADAETARADLSEKRCMSVLLIIANSKTVLGLNGKLWLSFKVNKQFDSHHVIQFAYVTFMTLFKSL